MSAFTRANPRDVGLSADRLGRISAYLQKYVEEGRIPGYQVLVARYGRVAHFESGGYRDVDAAKDVEDDTIFRIYSMTKPVTSVALMTLYEQGAFQLDDPVGRYIPQLDELEVFDEGDEREYTTQPIERPITIRDLLTHTSGLTYEFMQAHPVDALYRARGIRAPGSDGTLEDLADALGQCPLLFQPGTRWSYSVATDVIGLLVEKLSERSLDSYLQETIFDPLGMKDTGFFVPEDELPRFAANYERRGHGFKLIDSPEESPYRHRPTLLSGGGGLVSTSADYLRFCQMLLNCGSLDGHRVISRKTVELMTMNHLPTGDDLTSMGQAVFSETPYDGIGFGLGFSVVIDPARSQILGSEGEFAWGGAASTAFWIDPREEMIVIFMTQLMPSSSYPIRRYLRVLANQAIVD